MFLRHLKYVTKKDFSFEMFSRGLWDVSLTGDLIETSQAHLMLAGLIFQMIYLSFWLNKTYCFNILEKIPFYINLVHIRHYFKVHLFRSIFFFWFASSQLLICLLYTLPRTLFRKQGQPPKVTTSVTFK